MTPRGSTFSGRTRESGGRAGLPINDGRAAHRIWALACRRPSPMGDEIDETSRGRARAGTQARRAPVQRLREKRTTADRIVIGS